jgi:hypothetical protein
VVATTSASRKAKGRRLQQAVRQDLIDRLGIDPGDILSTAMGQSGCDLYLSPAARERFRSASSAKRRNGSPCRSGGNNAPGTRQQRVSPPSSS